MSKINRISCEINELLLKKLEKKYYKIHKIVLYKIDLVTANIDIYDNSFVGYVTPNGTVVILKYDRGTYRTIRCPNFNSNVWHNGKYNGNMYLWSEQDDDKNIEILKEHAAKLLMGIYNDKIEKSNKLMSEADSIWESIMSIKGEEYGR